MTKPIILWKDGKPLLYCQHDEGDNWWVVNGAWDLQLHGSHGTVVRTGQQIIFDRITEAPKGKDYNEVLAKAEAQNAI